jgi:hypothetical protein
MPPTTTTTSVQASPRVQREVLRIDQDLHPDDDYEVVLDAWLDGDEIVDVRLQWIDTGDADRRSPFGRGVRRHLDVDYVRHGPRRWTVRLGASTSAWELSIERDAGGLSASARVRSNGASVDRCRVDAARIDSRRVLGIPVGVARIVVSCTDDAGAVHEGELEAAR